MVAYPYGLKAAAVAAAVQRNGRIVTVGETELSNKRYALISMRILKNGRLDPSYGNGGWVELSIGGTGAGNAILILRNGEILIGGAGRSAANQPIGFAAVKLQPNGQLDKSFGKNGIATVAIGSGASANAIAVQPDGKIVLAGTADDGYDRFAAARLNADGSLDRSFGNGGTATFAQPGAAWGMGLRNDGTIVLAGEYIPGAGSALYNLLSGIGLGSVGRRLTSGEQYMAAALSPAGKPDPSFGNDGVVALPIGVAAACTAIAVQPDGEVVLAGSAFTNTGISATVRLTPNGTLDHDFGVKGISESPLYNPVNAVALAPDGKILVAATGPTAIRLDPGGVPDPTFAANGVDQIGTGTGNAANGVTVDPRTGDIILTGAATLSGRIELSVVRLRGS